MTAIAGINHNHAETYPRPDVLVRNITHQSAAHCYTAPFCNDTIPRRKKREEYYIIAVYRMIKT